MVLRSGSTHAAGVLPLRSSLLASRIAALLEGLEFTCSARGRAQLEKGVRGLRSVTATAGADAARITEELIVAADAIVEALREIVPFIAHAPLFGGKIYCQT